MLSLAYGLLAAGSTVLGGTMVVLARTWSLQHRSLVLSFAAGVLVSLAFVEILPETLETTRLGAPFFVAGFVLMYIVEQVLPHHSHAEDGDASLSLAEQRLAWLAWIGLLFHSLVDGLALAAGAALGHEMVRAVALGVVLHEFPEGLVAAAMLVAQGASVRKTLALTALVAFATPLGALVSVMLLQVIPADHLQVAASLAIAMAGGTFLYVGAADLLHRYHEGRHASVRETLAFLAGLAAFIATVLVS